MKRNKEVIKNVKFIGFKVYSRKRFFETRIRFISETSPIANPSIILFGKDDVLPSGISSLFQGTAWREFVTNIITWSIYNLAIAGKINIIVFKDEQTYLRILKFDYESVGLELISDEPTLDFFENLILKQIKKNLLINKSKLDGKQIISDVIDECIGKGEMNYPAKKFIEVVLSKNSKQFNWFDMENDYAILGLIKEFNIKIDEIKKTQLNAQYSELTKGYTANLKKSNGMKFFHDEMELLIPRDFISRHPSSDGN